MSATCPWCDAPRKEGIQCARCGAIYAKAEALRAGQPAAADVEVVPRVRPPVAAPAAPAAPALSPRLRDALRQEWRYRLAALPLALLSSLIIYSTSGGKFLLRAFLGRLLHEPGHALTAWWCGIFAVPSLWVTHHGESRGLITPLLLGAANGALIFLGIRARRPGLVAAGAGLGLLQLIGTFFLSLHTALLLITFGGDGAGMILATVLMASFGAGHQTKLYQDGLRWGFLVIGAGGFVDLFGTWWQARRDADAIPYGEIEGTGLSDPSKLTEVYGWSERAMVGRYFALGLVCLAVLVVVWLWGVWQARTLARELA